MEKSIHTPRFDRSADRTASPTNEGGRLISYADERRLLDILIDDGRCCCCCRDDNFIVAVVARSLLESENDEDTAIVECLDALDGGEIDHAKIDIDDDTDNGDDSNSMMRRVWDLVFVGRRFILFDSQGEEVRGEDWAGR